MSQSQSSNFSGYQVSKSRISKYRILGLVGRGQFGKVLCARDRETKSLVALKELEQKRFPTSKLLRELRFLISLQHPNIVSCQSLVHSKNCRYLVMEYCASGTLRELIEHHYQLTPQQCILLAIDILLGLEHAHNAEIIHCDLKPENVLLTLTTNGWQAKLSDFGIARLSQESSEEGGNTGSPGYMAPERFYGQFSIASDIYAVGIMLYEMLFKDRPFVGKPSELMSAHMNQRVSIPASVPRSLQEIILKALEKLPARRYASAHQMLEALQAIVNTAELIHLKLELISPFADLPPICLAEKSDLLHWLDLSDCLFPAETRREASRRVVAIAESSSMFARDLGNELSHASIYSATTTHLQNHTLLGNLGFKPEATTVTKFNSKIIAIVVSPSEIAFVITQQTIHRQIRGKWQTLYQLNPQPASSVATPAPQAFPSFLWAISPKADWIAVAIDNSLEIKNLKYSRSMKLGFNQRTIHFLVAVDRHHLVAIANHPKTQDSRLIVISRRGNIMGKTTLPAEIAQAIAGKPSNRLLLVEASHAKTILLIEIQPYHITRIVLAYQPILVAPTSWGYAITALDDRSPDSQDKISSVIMLIDGYGQNLGCLKLEGEILAIAAIGFDKLAISVIQGEQNRLCAINLRALEVDLIF
jgi:serine/threonine protein kinase